MDTAKVFTNGRSQAIRLPKAYRFDEDEVMITRVDDMVILFPRHKAWDLMARGIQAFSEDCLRERDQPARAEERDHP